MSKAHAFRHKSAESVYGGCSGSGAEQARTSLDSVVDGLSAQRESASTSFLARNLAEYLPNQRFNVAGAKVTSASELVVRGSVEYAKGVAGFYVPGGPNADASSGTKIDFDDPRAQWRVMEIGVRVKDSVGAEPDDVERVALSVTSDDYARIVDDASRLGDVVVVLERKGSYDVDGGLRRVPEFGALLGQERPDGTIDFAGLGSDDYKDFIGELTTWAAIKAEFSKSKSIIATDRIHNRI